MKELVEWFMQEAANKALQLTARSQVTFNISLGAACAPQLEGPALDCFLKRSMRGGNI
jgi:hypothetical protein